MEITFRTNKLGKLCNCHRNAVKKWGEKRAFLVRTRLDDLRAASNLDEMRYLPGDCHEYKHAKGKDHILTLDLDGGFRLFFRPSNEPIPLLRDAVSLDWARVTHIEVTDVKDPHE